ncbi:Fe-S cluster assembly protein SufD [Deinococcus radiophilus]|uniref:Fe-S cluster assembly protein SufD n=1 Tax=Deinococcus radiophilus TaxID=32062 RepID=A0A3S0KHH1_9DEIO|nr:Fe-S cluster assembly protein SufD [Deinococcus radiophilus]RTR30947.1 Fe-S cluster assembly protein SufD [Deinococcus radiophilus]UFA49532.1 Fe-S cluster assembly protein SufD [Deinococcus radiophilus]
MTQFTETLSQVGGPEWLQAKRQESLALFESLDVPTEAVEAWKYTRVDVDFGALRPHPRRDAVQDVSALPASVQKRLSSTDVGAFLVFDGPDVVYRTELPQDLADKGVIFTDLRTAVEQHAGLVQQYLYSVVPAEVPDDTTIAAPGTTPSKSPDPSEGKFSALAAALWTNGAFVYVPRGVEVELPLGSFRVMSESGTYTATRTLAVVEDNASAVFIDEQDSEPLENAYAIGAVELMVKSGARLRYVSIQNWGKGVTHIQRQRGDVDRDGKLNSLVVTMGGTLSRTEMQSYVRGSGAESEMLALYFADEDQHFDHYTLQHHAAPNAYSDLLYKGVGADQSVGVFSGMIKVDLGAQKTDAYQKHRTLMLSSEARNFSVPQLEINANDVRCSHGSTTGPVGEEEMFYLRSRGISKETAEKMLVTAFLEDVLGRVPLKSVTDYIEGIIAEKVGAV